MEFAADILENLPTTVIGIVALGTLIIGGITYAFFKDEHWALRLLSFLVIVFGFGLLVFAFVFHAEPSSPDGAPKAEALPCAEGDLECLTQQMEQQRSNE